MSDIIKPGGLNRKREIQEWEDGGYSFDGRREYILLNKIVMKCYHY